MHIKRVFWVLLLIVLLLDIQLPQASAHVLLSNNTVGGVLHIDPEDDPIAGQPAKFYIELKDKQNQFTLEQCECVLTISQGEQQIFFQTLLPNQTGLGSPVVTYVFPEKNVYTVRINGMPKIADSFNPFALTYDIRVVREVPMSGEQAVSATKGFVGRHIAHGIVVGLAFVVVFGLYVKDRLAGMNNNQKVR